MRPLELCIRMLLGVLVVVPGLGCNRLSPEQQTYVRELMEFRSLRDGFVVSEKGPLLPLQRQQFKGLAYYNVNFDLIFEADLEVFAQADTIQFVTSTETVEDYLRYALFRFQHAGKEHRLTVYKPLGDVHLFLPFADATSGDETYGAGRYVDLQRLNGPRYRLDFNRAYNPYCAYNSSWVCPIPPLENHLELAIRAGEKNFPYPQGH